MSATTTLRDEPSAFTEKKRRWIYPRIVKGKFYRYRNLLSYVLLGFLFSGPFLKLGGEQLILLNVLERKFVFFGLIFWPQDFYLFALAVLTFLVFIVLFTGVFGRVWCGWACPQTIFMEMVFRKIEVWIEGDHLKQKKLNEGPLTTEKVLKKTAKHVLFILISFFIANIFLAYIIGSGPLLKIMSEPPLNHLSGLISICIFTAIFYVVFAYVREIVCIVLCPYGRLQGVLLDNKSMIVAYDYVRGEPRGKRSKEAANSKGDCIDCNLCVHVCPTGIDIRKGTQLECINCTACIDACDMVMEKINRPLNLIGFKSEEQLKTGEPFRISKRIYGYSALLLVLLSVLSYLLISRSDIDTTVLRAGGTLYQLRDDGMVSNLFNAELVNKTNHEISFEMKPAEEGYKIQYIRRETKIAGGSSMKLTFFIIHSQKGIKQYKSTIGLNMFSQGKLISRFKTNFIAPPNF